MRKLRPGDCVGVFSSSAPTNADAIERLTAYFTKRGYRVKVAPHTLANRGFMAGSVEERVSDFHSLLTDQDVACIMTANGGASAIQMVSLLDYNAIRSNPKIICGLSDPTSVLNAITTKTGVSTFHGPNGYNFGHKTPTEFTENSWWSIAGGEHAVPYPFPVDDQIRVLKTAGADQVQGRVFGGNLRSILYLLGSEYMPRLDHSILFVEEIGLQVHEMDALLNQLVLSGRVDKLAGLIVGQNVGCEEKEYAGSESVEEMILRVFERHNFPIVHNVPLGHTSDKITIPLGCQVRLTTEPVGLFLMSSPFE